MTTPLNELNDLLTPSRRRIPRAIDDGVGVITDEQLDKSYLVPDYDMHLMPDHATLFPSGKKLHWDVPGEAEAFEKLREGYFFSKFHKYPIKTAMKQLQMVNGTAKEIYRLANGRRTGNEIYRALLSKYNEPYGKNQESIYKFMRGMVKRHHVNLEAQPRTTTCRSSGSEDYYYPPHMSIEVTANCNIRCIHCYGSFEQSRFDALDADRLINTLEKMQEEGLRSVELTGGECTTHPEFARILKYCVERLQLVGVLTNAVSIKEEVFDVLLTHTHNTMAQICINGDREYHDTFTKVKHSYNKAMKAITRLAQAGMIIRSPMNLTFENYHLVEQTMHAVQDAGSSIFLATWVDAAYGRAQDLPETPSADYDVLGGNTTTNGHACSNMVRGTTCTDRTEMTKTHIDTMERLARDYPGFVMYRYAEDAQQMIKFDKGCGAGRRTLYLASNGKIGLCPMSVETGIPGWGVLNEDGGMTDAVRTDFAKHFATIPAPNENDCMFCPHELEHRGCLLHGIMQFMKTPDKCAWGKKHNVKKLVDHGYHTLTKKPDGSYDFPETNGCGSKGGGCGGSGKLKEEPLVQLGLLN